MAILSETDTAPETLSTKYLTEGFMRGGKLVERKRVKYDVVKVTSYASVPTAIGSVNDEAVNVGYLNTKNTALKNELTTSINKVKSTADKLVIPEPELPAKPVSARDAAFAPAFGAVDSTVSVMVPASPHSGQIPCQRRNLAPQEEHM